jgi:hypothetical protein
MREICGLLLYLLMFIVHVQLDWLFASWSCCECVKVCVVSQLVIDWQLNATATAALASKS